MRNEVLDNRFLRLYILFSLLMAVAGFVFADEPDASLEDKSPADTAAVAGARSPWSVADVDTASSDDQASYFDDLKKLIEKSHENIKTVNEKNKEQEVFKRNQRRAEQARAYYEMGLELTNEGQLDEARAYFDKAIRIFEHPEMAGYMQEANWVNPDYKVITQYARRIDKDAQVKQQRMLEEQQKILYQQRRAEEVARSKAEALHRQELKIKERAHRRQLEEQVQFNYKAALALFNNKAMDEALQNFNYIEKTCPGYKSTTAYILRIKQWQFEQQLQKTKEQKRQQQQARQQQRRQLELEVNETYTSALDYYRTRNFEAAREGFLKVNKTIPDYKATGRYLSKIEDKINQAQSLYQEAVALYDNKVIDEALKKFNDIEKIYPNFKSTRDYIGGIKQWQLKQQRQLEVQKRQEQQMRQLELEVNVTYISALKDYRAHHFAAAKEEFLRVEEKIPGYEFTQKYLGQLEAMPAQEEKIKQARVAREEAQRRAESQRQEEQRRNIAKALEEKEQQAPAIKGQVVSPAVKGKEEKIKQAQFAREETQRRAELLRQEYERQTQLNVQREVIRKQLEDGLEAIYQQAVHLYQQGQYALAADKFKNIQDILPGYKRTAQYIDEARWKAQESQEYERQRQEEQRRNIAKALTEQEQASAIKGQVVSHEGTQRRADLLRQEYERQAQLNARREAVRKQLEDGVEVMYQEAVRSYQQGQYAIAADRFKDIEDILPSYKRAGQYRDEARQKAQTAVMPPAGSISETPVLTDTSNLPSVSTPAGHQDAVSKTLDLFDPNVK